MIKSIQTLEDLKKIAPEEYYSWYIPEVLSTSFPIRENGEDLVSIGTLSAKKQIPIICSPVAQEQVETLYLREGVAERICEAARNLMRATHERVTLKLTDTFRPLSLQRKYFNEIKEDIHSREGLEGKALWERVTQFIADPDLCPPHSTGGAVDCTLAYYKDKSELPMGTTVDAIDDKASTWHTDISPEERKNRFLLFETMTKVGFVNLPTEWWHYSFGDQYWAIVSGKNEAVYGTLESIPENIF